MDENHEEKNHKKTENKNILEWGENDCYLGRPSFFADKQFKNIFFSTWNANEVMYTYD